MELLILFFSFLIFLFCLYKLSKEDFIFIRKSISQEQIFNYAFLVGLSALFFARLFAIVTQSSLTSLNPLFFFLFLKPPGLSLAGGVIGGVVSLLVIASYKKLPRGRLLDFFSLSACCTFPAGYIGYALIGKEPQIILAVLLPLLYGIFAIFFIRILYPLLVRQALKEGAIAESFILTFSLISFFTRFAERKAGTIFLLGIHEIVLGILFISTAVLFIHRELLARPTRGGRR